MDIKKELVNLVDHFCLLNTKEGKIEFDKQFANLSKTLTVEQKKEAGKVLQGIMAERRAKRTDVNVKEKLSRIQNIISLSYIAEHYFKKDKSWLYHRINGTTVNGKPAAFTQEELTVLSNALKDIGTKISETSLSIH